MIDRIKPEENRMTSSCEKGSRSGRSSRSFTTSGISS